ncbi:MAG: hypothetical protein ACQGVK_19455 [Myxococcota bacterium]
MSDPGPSPAPWSAEAFNPVPGSENRIHADDVARTYGFRGGLVPGVVVSAYLLQPAALAWGRDWLERGRAEVVVHSPVYDGETFSVDVSEAAGKAYAAKLVDPRGAVCASAQVELPEAPAPPPARRGDRLLRRDDVRPTASRAVMEALREKGLGAMRARWSDAAEITHYLRDPQAMPALFRDERFANPAFILGLTNWVLGGNVKMSPWLHLQTDSQHYRAIPIDSELVVEAAIVDLFEKKGHEFVDVDVGVFGARADAAFARVRLRAIYQLRSP